MDDLGVPLFLETPIYNKQISSGQIDRLKTAPQILVYFRIG